MNNIMMICSRNASNFGYNSIFTPILEDAHLFGCLGKSSDIVKKEMFTFQYKEIQVALRPEVTASVAKSIINNNIRKGKFCYYGPNFRKERPQKGRYRQFYQFGCESVGNPSPWREIECFLIISRILNELRIQYKILINHIGCEENRVKYIEVLKEYFVTNIEELSLNSRQRLLENRILRILDSKEDEEVLKHAPSIINFLSESEISELKQVCAFLEESNIDYAIDHKLVRGLDYYNSIVFEIVSSCGGASQNAIGGGGAYDSLFKQMGSFSRSAFGFAFGIERLLLCDPYVKKNKSATLCLFGDHYRSIDIIANSFTINGIFSNIREALQHATSHESDNLIIIDDNYPKISVKNLKTRIQDQLDIHTLYKISL